MYNIFLSNLDCCKEKFPCEKSEVKKVANDVKSVPVFKTVSPVTQLALVEVNKASTNEIGEVVIRGIINKTVPITIKMQKESNITADGDKFKRVIKVPAFRSSHTLIIRK